MTAFFLSTLLLLPAPPSKAPRGRAARLSTITNVEDVTPVWEMGGIMSGYFSYYGQRPTDGMIAYGIERGYLPDDWGGAYVAVVDCGRVSSVIWIDVGRGWEPALVFDCLGADGDPAMWARERWLFELDYYSSVQVGSFGKGLQPGLMAFDSQDSGG